MGNELFESLSSESNATDSRPSGNSVAANEVLCLGKQFATESDRRKYFIQELKQLLPDLRRLEGFPFGEEEDILRLSDPPFFTACPNPWLRDFVRVWNEEKSALEQRGSRTLDFQVSEPYASDVSEGKNNSIYNAHSYHTKVPHPAIMRYILHYTQPGDIILDSFAGTGMTAVAAKVCDDPDPDLKFKIETEFRNQQLEVPIWGARKTICSDLSPVASFIAYNYNSSIDAREFDRTAREILRELEDECGWLYATRHSVKQFGNDVVVPGRVNYVVWSDVFECPSCGGDVVFWNVAIDKDAGEVRDEFPCPTCGALQTKRSLNHRLVTIFDDALGKSIRQIKTVPVLINYTSNGKRYEKDPDTFDLELIEKIAHMPIPYWYPSERMPLGDESRRNDDIGLTHVHHFYTRRNLWVKASFVQKAKRGALPNHLIQAVLGGLSVSTKMARFRVQAWVSKARGPMSGMMAGTLYVPSTSAEQNIMNVIEEKIGASSRAAMPSGWLAAIQVASAAFTGLDDNTIDYIFTDPPFGANIMYSELNFISESWMGLKTNIATEAVESRSQGKNLFSYQELMLRCFREYYRVLKPGKWMTVEFSNTGAAVWNGIQTSIQRAGFVIANVAALDKQQGSFKAVTTPTAVKQDLVISCYKPSDDFDQRFRTQSGEVNAWDFVSEHLNHLPVAIFREGTTTSVIERTPRILYDRLVSFYLMRNLSVPLDAADFQSKLRTRFRESDGMFFSQEQVQQYDELKRKAGINKQLNLFMDIIYSETDGVAWLKDFLEKTPAKYQDIQPSFRKANATTRKGEKEIELSTLLTENFIQQDNLTWRIPNQNEAKDCEILRNKTLLRDFNHCLDEANAAKPKKIKDVRLEALRVGFRVLWEKKEFGTLLKVADLIPQNLLLEDETLLTYYDIAKDRV